MKTPYLINRIVGFGNFDVLVDDSDVTYEYFTAHGLGHKIVKVNPRLPHSSYVLDIVNAIIRTLRSKSTYTGEVTLTQENDTLFSIDSYPYLCFEDPLYYPLVHMQDRVDQNVTVNRA